MIVEVSDDPADEHFTCALCNANEALVMKVEQGGESDVHSARNTKLVTGTSFTDSIID